LRASTNGLDIRTSTGAFLGATGDVTAPVADDNPALAFIVRLRDPEFVLQTTIKQGGTLMPAFCQSSKVIANELGGHLGPDAVRRPARSRPVHPPETCFVGEHDL
jgi:hypothetical protein